MSATAQAVILLSLMSCLTVWIGVLLALRLRESERAIAVGIGFSTGVMVLISLLELIPESIAAMGWGATLTSASAGAALVWAAHFLIPHTYGFAMLSALAEPLGALIGLAAVDLAPDLNAHFLALAAGAMLFVSAHELVPMAMRYRRPGHFLGGIGLSAPVYGLLALLTFGLASR